MKIGTVAAPVILLLASFVAGCGASSNSASPVNGNSVDSNHQPATLKFTYWGSPIEKDTVAKNVQAFEKKYPWITVDAQYIPSSEYTVKITSMVAANAAPDVAYLSPAQGLPWAEQGKILNLFDFMNTDTEMNINSIMPNALYKWGPDKIFGWTMQTYGLLYNKDLFQKANAELPPADGQHAWTWDQFVNMAQKLTLDESGRNALDPKFDPGKIKQYGVEFGTDASTWMNMVFSNGGDYISKDGKSIGLTDPKASEAIQKLADLVNKYHVAPSPLQVNNMPAPTVALENGQVAMTMDGQWNLLDLGQSKTNYGIGVLPSMGKSETEISGSPTVIFSSTKYPEAAWLFLKNLRNPNLNIDLFSKGLWMPYQKSWYTDPQLLAKWAEGNPAHPSTYKTAIVDQVLNNGVMGPTGEVKNFSQIDALIEPALENVWLGKDTAENALKQIEPKVQPLIQGRYQ